MYISVVTPVYGCQTALAELYLRLKDTLTKISPEFEIIFVNDSSPDNAWDAILMLIKEDNRIKAINLSRNFGQHYAIAAGLQHCSGQWIVVMDCDLQDRPEEILNLYERTKKGYDIVLAQRSVRIDNFFKRTFSKIFYKILGYLTDTKQDSSIANFGLYRNTVIKSVIEMGDRYRFFPAMIKWVGFLQTAIPIEHAKRTHGETSYSFKKLVNLAIDTIFTFSDKPLRLTVKLGLLMVMISFFFTIYNFYRYFDGQIVERGWTSVIISIWFLSGLIIFILGIIGLYIGRIFNQVKNRPLFIIKDKINL